uniref:Uncharacterized protein n=1 Tax=Grammatophora oceanica TaxID=210454 RepID=A0A7S1VMR4_9STRA
MEISRELSSALMSTSAKECAADTIIRLSTLDGEVYPPYLQFIISPLMHSELVEDHELATKVADFSLAVAPDSLKECFGRTKSMELEHKKVIDMFGRYPHRNDKLGRESTPEEIEWLASDDLPAWAKSQ